MRLRKKQPESVAPDLSEQFAALYERLQELERRVEALEHTLTGQESPPVKKLEIRDISRGRTRKPFVDEG